RGCEASSIAHPRARGLRAREANTGGVAPARVAAVRRTNADGAFLRLDERGHSVAWWPSEDRALSRIQDGRTGLMARLRPETASGRVRPLRPARRLSRAAEPRAALPRPRRGAHRGDVGGAARRAGSEQARYRRYGTSSEHKPERAAAARLLD